MLHGHPVLAFDFVQDLLSGDLQVAPGYRLYPHNRAFSGDCQYENIWATGLKKDPGQACLMVHEVDKAQLEGVY
jgi:hypothetical protein